jgi:hypothetical protein
LVAVPDNREQRKDALKKTLYTLLMLAFWSTALAAEEEKPAFGIAFSGFVKTDIFYDSRQTTSIREGHFLLFPKPVLLDPIGADINDQSNMNMLSLQTRVQGKVTAPDTFGAHTSGLIEAEFFGHSDADINGFRLRHAYLRLNWPRTEVLVGQYWHPMFITESFPDVVSFNTGAPFQPFNRSPQVRLTHHLGPTSIALTALSQRDFTSAGPSGINSGYLRNAAAPEVNLKVQYGVGDAAIGTETVVGAGLNHLRIRPRLVTDAGFRTTEKVGGLAGMVFFKRRLPAWTVKAEAVYGQNAHHLTMIGGYACRNVEPETLAVDYTTLNTFSVWSDIHSNRRTLQPGLFLGYSKNLGAEDNIGGACYARGFDIDSLYRISPRLVFNAGRFRFSTETEWTVAAYGNPDARGVVQDAKPIGNLRVLLATHLFF